MNLPKEDIAVTATYLTPPPHPAAIKRENSESSFLGKDRYKLWMLVALLLLAIWSMLTGSLTLKSTPAAVNISDSIANEFSSASVFSSSADDFDVLEVTERQKIVERFWKAYIHGGGRGGGRARLPKFWEEAFQAAFDSLVSDSPGVRDDAVVEIAKMSMRSANLYLLSSAQSTHSGISSRKLKLFR